MTEQARETPEPLTPEEMGDFAVLYGRATPEQRAVLRAVTPDPAEPGLDVERLAEAMRSIDLELADLPGGESLADPADDPVRREYAAEVARRYDRLAGTRA
jgi:hypothetical protein